MRVLLDECLPRGLKKYLQAHEVVTVPEAGWAGKKNGDLLRTANGSIDVFVTIDKNLTSQQAIGELSFGIVVLKVNSNRLADIVVWSAEILDAISRVEHGQALSVGG